MNDFPLSTSVLKIFVKEKRSAKRSSRPSMPENLLPIVGFAREHGRITIREAIRQSGGNRNTLKGHFRNLVERDQLIWHGSGRGVWYELA